MTTRATIAVTDYTFANLDLEQAVLADSGCELIGYQCKTEAQLVAAVAGADAVITQFARINANVIGAMSRTRAIVRYGIGVDNVDLEAARARAIPVSNIPDYCIDEVADHTLAFILGLTRQVVTHSTDIRAGNWRLAAALPAMRVLREQTVGVVGCGRIGRAVVSRLLAFKCRVLVFDPVLSAADIAATGASPATLDEMLSACDVLTLHCPSTPATRQLVGAASLAKMKPGGPAGQPGARRPGRHAGAGGGPAKWSIVGCRARCVRPRAAAARPCAARPAECHPGAAYRVHQPERGAQAARRRGAACACGRAGRIAARCGQWRCTGAPIRLSDVGKRK